MEDAIKEQIAEKMLPEATLWTLLQASERQGRTDLMDFYLGELVSVLFEKRRILQERMAAVNPPGAPGAPGPGGPPGGGGPPTGGPRPGGGPPSPPGGPPGFRPEVMPDAMLGVPPPMPTPPVGPLVPPGTPRPGAQGAP